MIGSYVAPSRPSSYAPRLPDSTRGRPFLLVLLVVLLLLAYFVGSHRGRHECHIESDWLLIYKVARGSIIFQPTSTTLTCSGRERGASMCGLPLGRLDGGVTSPTGVQSGDVRI